MASFRGAIMHCFPFRDHPLSKCEKFFQKTMRIRGKKCEFFGKFCACTKWMISYKNALAKINKYKFCIYHTIKIGSFPIDLE